LHASLIIRGALGEARRDFQFEWHSSFDALALAQRIVGPIE